jgi:hypothetical protein
MIVVHEESALMPIVSLFFLVECEGRKLILGAICLILWFLLSK